MSVPIQMILIKTALLSLTLALALSLSIGVLAVLDPRRARELNRILSHRISLRRRTRFLERPIVMERHFYRHHRVYGAIVAVLALFLLEYVAFRYDPRAMQLLLPNDGREAAIAAAGRFVEILLWIGGVFAVIVGSIMFTRPSALKIFERRSNQWLSTRRGLKGLQTRLFDGDSLFERHPRAFGAIVSCLSLACLIGIAIYGSAIWAARL